MGVAGLIGVVMLAVIAGFIFTRPYGWAAPARLAFSYVAGLGLITLQMFFYSLLSIRYGMAVIALPWAVALIASAYLFKRRGYSAQDGIATEFAGLSAVEWAATAIIAAQAVFAVVNSVMLPIKGFDAWVIWLLKGQAFYIDKGVSYAFFLNGVYSNGNLSYQYPLSIPLAATLGYLGMGQVDDQAVKLLFSLYFVALIPAAYYFLRGITSREGSLILLAMLVTVPRMMQQAGLDGVGYADLPLSVYFLGAGGFGYRYIQGRDKMDFLAAIFFMSLGAWVKNEGLTLLASGACLLSAYAIYADKRKGAGLAIIAAAIILVIVLPWQLYKSALPEISGTMMSGLSAGSMLRNASRLPVIWKTIGPKLFTANKYHLTWPLYILSAVVSRKRFKELPYLFLNAIIILQFAVYIFVYMITAFDMVPQIDTSFDRLTIHLIPLVYLSIGAAWTDLFGRDKTAAPITP
ncbi:MAG: hypothetical protein HY894_02615 [Deltaproteobacteria bacterium]|nr:hypothetical protein [Deltaproteobacteria bacterium]